MGSTLVEGGWQFRLHSQEMEEDNFLLIMWGKQVSASIINPDHAATQDVPKLVCLGVEFLDKSEGFFPLKHQKQVTASSHFGSWNK